MWLLYQLAMGLALGVAAPVLLLRRGRHYLTTVPGRLGRYDATTPGAPVWIHAVSVGEVGVAATLARALPTEIPLLVTTITPTGQKQARNTFAARAAVAYLPYELGFAVRRFFRRFSPRALILVEGDYWPLVLHAARRRGLPIAVVNGRVGDRSFRRLQRLRPLRGALFSPVDRFGMQSEEDRQRLLRLGVEPEAVLTTGNLKYETSRPEPLPELERAIRRIARDRPILVAGSTMAGEEEELLEAFRRIGGGKRALLLLAPRHPERWDRVAELLGASDMEWLRRSRLDGEADRLAGERLAILLLDSLGELGSLYRLGTSAFIGGTLAPTGGHNPLEAARFSVPIVVGPSMENFREMSEQFDRREAWKRVHDASSLAEAWGEWLDDPVAARETGERGFALLDSQRGALEKTLRMLDPLLRM